MVDFLICDAGGSWQQRDIMLIPNGTDEESIDQIQAFYGAEKMFYYICTETPVADLEKLSGLAETKSLSQFLNQSKDTA